MAKLIKQVRLDKSLINQVESISNEFHDGNFTAAIESLLMQSLIMRSLDIKTRWMMYDHVKQSEYERTDKETGIPNVRQLIDALHI